MLSSVVSTVVACPASSAAETVATAVPAEPINNAAAIAAPAMNFEIVLFFIFIDLPKYSWNKTIIPVFDYTI